VQFHQYVDVVPFVVHVPAITPLVCAAPVLPLVVASAPATHSLSLSMPSCDPLVTLSPYSLNLQTFFHHKWIYLQLYSPSALLTTFLLHLSHGGVLPPATTDGVALYEFVTISSLYPCP